MDYTKQSDEINKDIQIGYKWASEALRSWSGADLTALVTRIDHFEAFTPRNLGTEGLAFGIARYLWGCVLKRSLDGGTKPLKEAESAICNLDETAGRRVVLIRYQHMQKISELRDYLTHYFKNRKAATVC